jgi:hypothetical protein
MENTQYGYFRDLSIPFPALFAVLRALIIVINALELNSFYSKGIERLDQFP